VDRLIKLKNRLKDFPKEVMDQTVVL